MKKIAMAMVIGLVSFSVQGQTERGDWLVGGNVRLNTADNSTTFELAPNAGYFVWNNVALGGRFSYLYDKLGQSKISRLSVGPLVRYYMGQGTLKPFGQFDVNFLSNKVTTEQSNSTTESGSSFFLGAGLAVFLNRNVALEGLLGYRNTKVENKSRDGGLAASFGFQVYIGRLGRLVEPVKQAVEQ